MNLKFNLSAVKHSKYNHVIINHAVWKIYKVSMYLCSLPFICPYHSRTKSIYKYRPPTIQYTYKYIYIHLYMYDHDGHILYEDDDVVTMLWLSNTTNVRRRHDECLYVLRKCIYVYAIRWCHSLEWRWKWNHIRRRMDWRGSGAGGCLCGGICTNISRAVSGHSHTFTLPIQIHSISYVLPLGAPYSLYLRPTPSGSDVLRAERVSYGPKCLRININPWLLWAHFVIVIVTRLWRMVYVWEANK